MWPATQHSHEASASNAIAHLGTHDLHQVRRLGAAAVGLVVCLGVVVDVLGPDDLDVPGPAPRAVLLAVRPGGVGQLEDLFEPQGLVGGDAPRVELGDLADGGLEEDKEPVGPEGLGKQSGVVWGGGEIENGVREEGMAAGAVEMGGEEGIYGADMEVYGGQVFGPPEVAHQPERVSGLRGLAIESVEHGGPSAAVVVEDGLCVWVEMEAQASVAAVLWTGAQLTCSGMDVGLDEGATQGRGDGLVAGVDGTSEVEGEAAHAGAGFEDF